VLLVVFIRYILARVDHLHVQHVWVGLADLSRFVNEMVVGGNTLSHSQPVVRCLSRLALRFKTTGFFVWGLFGQWRAVDILRT